MGRKEGGNEKIGAKPLTKKLLNPIYGHKMLLFNGISLKRARSLGELRDYKALV
jgi:hypothetical protein